MKILMFTPYVPYPPHSGGQTRTFNLIKNLSSKHDITSFCFLRVDQPKPELLELRKYCSKINIFPRKRAWASISKILLTGISPYPYLANMYFYGSVKRAIEEELNSHSYDIIHVETYYIMPNLPATKVPILLAEQTIEYLVYQHFAQASKFWFLKPFLYTDVAKHQYWERYYWQKARRILAMSEEDKSKMLELVPNLDVDIVPNGVDIEYFSKPVAVPQKRGQHFLFVGNFNWLQNREAVGILVEAIWPKIKSALPQSKLWIVGQNPPDSIRKLAIGDISVSADIEDIRISYQGSDVLLAPLYGGGGTRYKILEAMASGLPVVTTQIGITGIGAKNDYHALISNDLGTLAELALKVVQNKSLARRLSSNAKRLVEQRFAWTKISAKLDEIYEQTAKED